jgi:hypothetical protein
LPPTGEYLKSDPPDRYAADRLKKQDETGEVTTLPHARDRKGNFRTVRLGI